MKITTFDKIAGVAILLSLAFTIVVAMTSWVWFPTPGDWSNIARIPRSMENYMALLLPPVTMLLYLLIRRLYFKKEF